MINFDHSCLVVFEDLLDRVWIKEEKGFLAGTSALTCFSRNPPDQTGSQLLAARRGSTGKLTATTAVAWATSPAAGGPCCR